MNEKTYCIHLNIPPEEWQRLYRGKAKQVRCQSLEGVTIRFDANHLRSFVSHSGVQGTFELKIDNQHRFLSIRKLD